MFLAFPVLALFLAADRMTAADYPAVPSQGLLGNPPPPPFRIVPAPPAASTAATNAALPQPGEIELRIQSRLLSVLAQDHRQRAEAATKGEQAQRAKWEADLAEELNSRSSNILAQLEELSVRKQALVNGTAAEAAGPLSPAEIDYLAKIEGRLQAVQQAIAAATEETTAFALQAVTNRDTVVYGDNNMSLRLFEIGRDIKRLQTEQADLELKASQFWALRAVVRNAQNPPPPESSGGAARPSKDR